MSGGLIGKPNIPTISSASGVWGLREQLRAKRDSIWPFPNLELGLTLSRTNTASGTITDDDGTVDTVYAANLIFPVSPSDGLIWETGGTGQGAWLGIRDSSTTMRLRGGDGAASKTASDIDTAVLDITDFPKDGKEHVIIWDFKISTGTVRIFIDGNLRGTASATGGTFDTNQFAGVNDGAYITNSTTGVPVGESATASNFTEAGSGMRVYLSQLVNY